MSGATGSRPWSAWRIRGARWSRRSRRADAGASGRARRACPEPGPDRCRAARLPLAVVPYDDRWRHPDSRGGAPSQSTQEDTLDMGDRANVIDRVDVYGYDLTYAHGDYVMSSGRVVNVLPSTVVRIRTRDGVDGFGETLPAREHIPARLRGRRARRVARARAGAHRRGCGEPRGRHRTDGCDPAWSGVREERRGCRVLGRPRASDRPLRRDAPWRSAPRGGAAVRRRAARTGRRDGRVRRA